MSRFIQYSGMQFLSRILSFLLLNPFCARIFGMASTELSNRDHLKPWSARWNNRRIGFHLQDVNPSIIKYASQLLGSDDFVPSEKTSVANSTSTKRVFVPLCGKAVDMAHLASLASSSTQTRVFVVGLEAVRVALEEFIKEHPSLNIVEGTSDGSESSATAERFDGDQITLWKADYFDLGEDTTSIPQLNALKGSFDAIYDRASMVAIDPGSRWEYVRILDRLLLVGGKILLVTLERKSDEHPEATQKGPPFSIPETTVRDLFDRCSALSDAYTYKITTLEETDQLVTNPQDKERYPELDQLLETVYLIEKVESVVVAPSKDSVLSEL